ncbi:hypothetical protein D5086_010057 [Populus alba]|uniref:Uncharacterized protein n=1 Tax=Populus alba TaxID=43335 RepID=A0ACC4CAX0_POPAL
MVIPPPVRLPRATQFLKPYVLKMHFTNTYVSAQVLHSPSATNQAPSGSNAMVMNGSAIANVHGLEGSLRTASKNEEQSQPEENAYATKEEKGNKYDALKYEVGVNSSRWSNWSLFPFIFQQKKSLSSVVLLGQMDSDNPFNQSSYSGAKALDYSSLLETFSP